MKDQEIRILQIMDETTVDGPGFRTAIYAAGCAHACPGCHNPQSWDFQAGTTWTVEELAERILDDPFANLTLSGGDPMYQAEGFAALAEAVKARSEKTIWCYTGFTFEQLMERPAARKLMAHIDVLVDGPFVAALRDEKLHFRGSSNQRLIDVPRSLEAGKAVMWDYRPLP